VADDVVSAATLPEGTVTVLFTDLVDSTHLNQQHGDEVANAIRRDVEQRAMELVDRHRGVLVKGMGDGLMVAFQSARRAVACAREIQVAVADRNRAHPGQQAIMRIGLHTGEVIEENGDLHGETVIIAKRIEGVAPAGGIYASDTVHGVLGTARSELVDRGEFELKGIDAPWRLYEITVDTGRAAPADSERSPYVGRVREREVFAGMVERAAAGRGGMVLLTGEAGAGKSRLIEEAAELARGRGMGVLVGHCQDMEVPPPYQPLVEQLEQAVRALPPETFREILGENAPEVARLLPELHRIYADIGESPTLPPDQERRYLLHGFGEFVERAAMRQPLMLCFEDLHWADESSLLLITALAQFANELPLLLVGSYRPGDVGPRDRLARTLEELTRHRLSSEINLAALSEDDVAALLAGRGGPSPPADLVALVYTETEGNPFFVEEVFLHLRERGVLFDDDGRWRSGIEIADTEVPRTVRLVIERRIERVGDDVRRALTAAAVAGRSASFELLLATAGLDEDALLDALETAEHATLVEGQSRGREVVYSFVHEQIRQTLLGDLSALRRQRQHLRVAEALRDLLGRAAEHHAAEIAHHLQLAGSAAPRDLTVEYLEQAARNAIVAVAPEDALHHADAALELLGDDDPARTAALLAVRARAHRAIGHIDDALADLATALQLAPAGPDHDEILRQRAGLYLDRFDGAAASDDLTVVLASVRARGDREAEIAAMLALGRANYVRSLDDTEFAAAARDTYAEAYALAAEAGNRRAMAEALLPTAWFSDYWTDYYPTGKANVEEALRLAADIGDEGLLIEAESAQLRFMQGLGMEERGEELRTRLEERHDPVRLKEHYFWLMWQYYFRGRLERCVETCDLGIELARQLGSAPVQYGSIKALALSELGRYDEVDAALDQEVTDDDHPFGQANQAFARAHYLNLLDAWEPAASAALDSMQRGSALMRVWMQAGMVTIATSLAARAGDAVHETTDRIIAMGRHAGLGPMPIAIADELLARGDPRAAIDVIQPRAGSLSAAGIGQEAPHLYERLARAYLDAGEPADALVAADRGLELTASTGQLPVSWRLHGSRAAALDALGRGDEADRERELARAEFEMLADRIADPDLRQWFEGQPLAYRWLGREAPR
jgi:class 3 adenylate cyclase